MRKDLDMEYYQGYEKRYQAVEQSGIAHWGNSEKDGILYDTLAKWVKDNGLAGKRVIEFACGEGSGGIILSELGVIYYGVDISATAVKIAKQRLKDYPNVHVGQLDMVKKSPEEKFDAALDVMGLHMLVTDADRQGYLRNAFNCLKDNSSMLFFRENYNEETEEREIKSIEEFKAMTGVDYDTPQKRVINGEEVYIPFLPSRARSKQGYISEMAAAGFTVESFALSKENNAMVSSADIYVRKP